MKKYISLLLGGFVFVSIIILNPRGPKEIKASNKKISATELLLRTTIQSLDFRDTISIENPCISINKKDVLLNEKSLDVYMDGNKNKYYFLAGTDSLCGYQKEYYYGIYTENPITEDQAIRIAEEYLSRIVPEFSAYTLLLVQYSECDIVYQLQYSYYINGIPSDDLINIYIQANGEVGAFMMPNRGAYQNLYIDPDLTKNYLEESDSNLVNQYITKTVEGVTLVQNYLITDNQSNEKIDQISILIK